MWRNILFSRACRRQTECECEYSRWASVSVLQISIWMRYSGVRLHLHAQSLLCFAICKCFRLPSTTCLHWNQYEIKFLMWKFHKPFESIRNEFLAETHNMHFFFFGGNTDLRVLVCVVLPFYHKLHCAGWRNRLRSKTSWKAHISILLISPGTLQVVLPIHALLQIRNNHRLFICWHLLIYGGYLLTRYSLKIKTLSIATNLHKKSEIEIR